MKKKIAMTVSLYLILYFFWDNHRIITTLMIAMIVYLMLNSLRVLLFIERNRFQQIVQKYITEMGIARCDQKIKDICLLSLETLKNEIIPYMVRSLLEGGSTQDFINNLRQKITQGRLSQKNEIWKRYGKTDLFLDFGHHQKKVIEPLLKNLEIELMKSQIDFNRLEYHLSVYLNTLIFGFIKLSVEEQDFNSKIINLLNNLDRVNQVSPESIAFRKSFARCERESIIALNTSMFL